jgi:hypothetical protein
LYSSPLASQLLAACKRFARLALALRTALMQETGEEPVPIAKSTLSDSIIFGVSTPLTSLEFGNALMKRLRDPFFFSEDSDRADKLVITEINDQFFATSAIIKTIVGWKRRRARE